MFTNVNYHATHTQTGENGKKYQCKMTNGVVDPETNDDWALVADGTVCGAPDSRSVSQKNIYILYDINRCLVSI